MTIAKAPQQESNKRPLWHWIKDNAEKSLFRLVGFVLLLFSMKFLFAENVVAFTAAGGAAVFCYLYANVSRFKRFKGLGFEAELWEDKKKEAEALIEQLKAIVEIYTNEIMITRVTKGRWGDGRSSRIRWIEHWKVFEKLTSEHGRLGQQINFTDLQRQLEAYFFFDALQSTISDVRSAINDGQIQVSEIIRKEFGAAISDAEGYAKRLAQQRSYHADLEEPIALASERKLAQSILNWFSVYKSGMQEQFGVEINLPQKANQTLLYFKKLEEQEKLSLSQDQIDAIANYLTDN